MKLVFLLFVYATCFTAFSQVADPDESKIKIEADGHLEARYDYQAEGEIERLQEALAIELSADFNGKLRVDALIQNNPTYGIEYHTFYDLNQGELLLNNEKFALKQFYITKPLSSTSEILAGALVANDKIGGHTSFGGNSWVDGGRISLHKNKSKISITVGSLNDLNEDIFSRSRRLNYAEIFISRKIWKNIIGEASFGAYEDESFLRGASTTDIEVFTDKLTSLTGEILINMKSGTAKGSGALGASTDLTQFFKYKAKRNLDFLVQYSYGDPDIGLRGQVNDDRYMTGNNLQLGLGTSLGKKKKINIQALADIRSDNRYQVLVKYDF